MFDFAKSLAKCPILPFFLLSFPQHLLSAYYVPVLNDVGDKREKKKAMAPDFCKTSRIGEQLLHTGLSFAVCPGSWGI